jgi:hypothetical protein
MNDLLSQVVTNVNALLASAGLTATVRPCRVTPQSHGHEIHISVSSIVPKEMNVKLVADVGYVEFGVTAFAPYPQRTVDELIAAEAWLNAFDEALMAAVPQWRTGWLLAKMMPVLRPSSPADLRGWRISASRIRIYA